MEVPFSEAEKRFVLAEAIKISSVPIDRLLTILNEGQVAPSWTEMLLPRGRNLKECMSAWDDLQKIPYSSLSFPPSFAPPTAASGSSSKRKSAPDNLDTTSAGPSQKRRQSGSDTIAARTIQPKPASNGSPQSFSPLAAGQQPKKRGRPSKADVEARNAEAIARGEVIPPPRSAGPRNPQMVGMTQFDARSPIQRDLAPSPRILAPSLPIGGEISMGSFSQMPSQIAATAPMVATATTSTMGLQGDATETDATTAKKKRIRPPSKQAKGPKSGESSFPSIDPQLGHSEPTIEPFVDASSIEQHAMMITPRPEPKPENPLPITTSAPQIEPPKPASSQHPDIK